MVFFLASHCDRSSRHLYFFQIVSETTIVPYIAKSDRLILQISKAFFLILQNRDRLRKRSEEEEKDVGPVTRYGFPPKKSSKMLKA